MRNAVAFSKLSDLLISLGFEMMRVRGSHIVFKNKESGSVVILPEKTRKSTLSRIHVASVKRILAECGLLDQDRFEELLK